MTAGNLLLGLHQNIGEPVHADITSVKGVNVNNIRDFHGGGDTLTPSAIASAVWGYGTRAVNVPPDMAPLDKVELYSIKPKLVVVTDALSSTLTTHITNSTQHLATSAQAQAAQAVLDESKVVLDSVMADMSKLQQADLNNIYAKIEELKLEVDSVLAASLAVPDKVWGKVV